MAVDPALLAFAFLGVALGGFLKGATGAGAPLVGVPILAVIFDVQMAVAIFTVLNVISNTWQAKTFYHEIVDRRFAWTHAMAAAVGVVPGTLLLAWLPTDLLMASMSVVVLVYVALRLGRPQWVLSRRKGRVWAAPFGFVGGVMQGAGGLSAPVAVPFLNALRTTRVDFIGTISVFFLCMAFLQAPTLVAVGILSWERVGLGILAAIPLFLGIWGGARAARGLSQAAFDRALLVLLVVIATKLAWDAVV